MKKLSPGEFETWLHDIGQKFDSLDDEERNRTLDYMIGRSGSRQLYHLHEKLNSLVKRDFLKQLPIELSFYVFKFLDVKSLLTCCQVSVTWNKVVNSCEEFWRRACYDTGAKRIALNNAKEYKTFFLSLHARRESLRKGNALHSQYLFGHTDRVMALYYHNNILATGSDDRTVRLWDCSTGQCLKVYQTHTVADLKIDEKYIITASYDSTAACWDRATGESLGHYRGHVAAVFSVDFDEHADILLTGGADYTVKLWRFSDCQLLHSFSTHSSSWVNKVLLHKPSPSSSHFSVICVDQSHVYLWNIGNRHEVSDARCWASADGCFLPSLLKQGTSLYICSTEAHRRLSFMQKICVEGDDQPQVTPLDFCGEENKAMLGIGERFSVFITEQPVGEKVLCIMQDNVKKLATLQLPECRYTPRFSSFTIGESAWLDGFDRNHACGLFFAASLKDHRIYLLKWKSS